MTGFLTDTKTSQVTRTAATLMPGAPLLSVQECQRPVANDPYGQ
jgi:hypothetical protein